MPNSADKVPCSIHGRTPCPTCLPSLRAAVQSQGVRTRRAHLARLPRRHRCTRAGDTGVGDVERRRSAQGCGHRERASAVAHPLSIVAGLPIGIKDLILTADMSTQMNSPLYEGWRSGRDSAAIYRCAVGAPSSRARRSRPSSASAPCRAVRHVCPDCRCDYHAIDVGPCADRTRVHWPPGDSALSSELGVPALSLPKLRVDGLPPGVQLIGFRDRDADLAAVAVWIDGVEG